MHRKPFDKMTKPELLEAIKEEHANHNKIDSLADRRAMKIDELNEKLEKLERRYQRTQMELARCQGYIDRVQDTEVTFKDLRRDESDMPTVEIIKPDGPGDGQLPEHIRPRQIDRQWSFGREEYILKK